MARHGSSPEMKVPMFELPPKTTKGKGIPVSGMLSRLPSRITLAACGRDWPERLLGHSLRLTDIPSPNLAVRHLNLCLLVKTLGRRTETPGCPHCQRESPTRLQLFIRRQRYHVLPHTVVLSRIAPAKRAPRRLAPSSTAPRRSAPWRSACSKFALRRLAPVRSA